MPAAHDGGLPAEKEGCNRMIHTSDEPSAITGNEASRKPRARRVSILANMIFPTNPRRVLREEEKSDNLGFKQAGVRISVLGVVIHDL